MAPEEIFSQLGLRMVNFFLHSYTFCPLFILFSPVWIRIQNTDPQISCIRIQFGSGCEFTTLVTCIVTFNEKSFL